MEVLFRTNFIANDVAKPVLPNAEFWLVFVGGFLFYTILYLFSSRIFSPRAFQTYEKLTKGDKVEWDSRIVSNVNAVVMSVMFPAAFVTDSAVFLANPATANTRTASLACAFAMSYFAYDLCLVLKNYATLGDIPTVIHHIIAGMTAFVTQLWSGMVFFYLLFGIVEATTPSVNLRWFLTKADMRESKAYFYNGLAMVGGFAVFRIGVVALVGAALVSYAEQIMTLPAGVYCMMIGGLYVPFSLLNFFWFYKIVTGAWKALKPRKQKTTQDPAQSVVAAANEQIKLEPAVAGATPVAETTPTPSVATSATTVKSANPHSASNEQPQTPGSPSLHAIRVSARAAIIALLVWVLGVNGFAYLQQTVYPMIMGIHLGLPQFLKTYLRKRGVGAGSRRPWGARRETPAEGTSSPLGVRRRPVNLDTASKDM